MKLCFIQHSGIAQKWKTGDPARCRAPDPLDAQVAQRNKRHQSTHTHTHTHLSLSLYLYLYSFCHISFAIICQVSYIIRHTSYTICRVSYVRYHILRLCVCMTRRAAFGRWAPTRWAARCATSRARSSALGSETNQAHQLITCLITYTFMYIYMREAPLGSILRPISDRNINN